MKTLHLSIIVILFVALSLSINVVFAQTSNNPDLTMVVKTGNVQGADYQNGTYTQTVEFGGNVGTVQTGQPVNIKIFKNNFLYKTDTIRAGDFYSDKLFWYQITVTGKSSLDTYKIDFTYGNQTVEEGLPVIPPPPPYPNTTNLTMHTPLTSPALQAPPPYLSQTLSPLKQFKSGIPLQKIQCRTDLVLVIKAHQGTPACVRQSSIATLVYRGWALLISTQPELTLRILGPYDGLQNLTGIVTIQNKTFFMTTFNGTLNPYSGYQEVTFHGINFTLFPQPQSLEISGKEFYADVGFSENVHEQLWLEAPIWADMGNLTITRLTHHMQPEAGIVSYNEQIKLLVSTDVNSSNSQTQTSDSSSALKLYLSTSSQVIQPGQPIGIAISVNNTLSSQVMVQDENSWKLNDLIVNPCTTAPYGIAIFDGFYSEINMTDGKPLTIFSLDALCPAYNKTTQTYVFQPSSGHVTMNNCTDTPSSCSSGYDMGSQISFNGVWNSGQIQPFKSGLYTIVGGDEWGHVAIEHFVVSNSTIFAGELGSMSCPMMYGGVQFGATIKNLTGFANYYNSTQYGNTFFLHPGMQGTINVQYSAPANVAWFQNNGNAALNVTNGEGLFYMANVTEGRSTISYTTSLYNDETGHHSMICHYGIQFGGGFTTPCDTDNTGDIPLVELPYASRLLHVGISTSFEPNSVMLYPGSNPVFTASVSTNSNAMPGVYWLSLGRSLCGPDVLAKLVVLP